MIETTRYVLDYLTMTNIFLELSNIPQLNNGGFDFGYCGILLLDAAAITRPYGDIMPNRSTKSKRKRDNGEACSREQQNAPPQIRSLHFLHEPVGWQE